VKILVLALSGIGDALMFTPALQLIKMHTPDAQIDALVMYKGVKEIYERTGYFTTIHHFDFLNASKLSALKFVLQLRGNYDASINVYPSNRKEYNLINFLIGAKKRCAVSYLRMNQQNLGFLNNVQVVEDDSLHNVEENILLCEKLLQTKFTDQPKLLFPLTREDELFGYKYVIDKGVGEEDVVVGFHPGCSTLKNHINRRWEPEKFAALALSLIERKKAKVLLFGGPEEYELLQTIHKKINSENAFIVKTHSLPQTASVMKRCNLFVTNDSSLMHVASALQLKVVALIGPTNVNYIHPWVTEYRIASLNLDCAPCFYYSPKPLVCSRQDQKYKCIKELYSESVFEIINSFI